MATEVQPTGTLRAWGWPLLALGVVLVVLVWPLFTIGGATDQGDTRGMLLFVGHVAPWLGLAAIGAGIALVVIASKRAASNREAVQRAVLARGSV